MNVNVVFEGGVTNEDSVEIGVLANQLGESDIDARKQREPAEAHVKSVGLITAMKNGLK